MIRGHDSNPATAKAEGLKPAWHQGVDFADIKGPDRAERALKAGAAGGHDVLMV